MQLTDILKCVDHSAVSKNKTSKSLQESSYMTSLDIRWCHFRQDSIANIKQPAKKKKKMLTQTWKFSKKLDMTI